jgi:mono/diheme cytochrome c family protein
MKRGYLIVPVVGVALLAPCSAGQEQTPAPDAERGRKALLTRAFTPALWPLKNYDTAWQLWGGLKEAPQPYDDAFRQRYGLHPAPYENGKLPMGLREGSGFLGKGIASDCMLCHAGSILGKSYVGLGNSALDIQALFEDLGGGKSKMPFTFTNVRGTSEAGTMAVFLLSYREPDLSLKTSPHAFELRDDLCEDTPAWWLLKKKKTMYHTGSTPARSVRSIMQFMLSPLNSRATFEKEEATFADIQAYILSLTPPKYPFAVDAKLAGRGEKVFLRNCASCHGTYGEKWTYPSKIVPLEEIGTDPTRHRGLSRKAGEHYNKSWFAQEKRPDGTVGFKIADTPGYQAPPLDGVWATGPYFHNGSVPTVYHVLNSKARPKIFTRSYRTDEQAYDKANLGWKVQVLPRGADANMTPFERRKIYDTTQPGRGNGGHLFGDDLTEDERRAVIEYLKTL